MGPATTAHGNAFCLGLDMSNVITRIESVEQARALPAGSVIGDTHGGVTFSDAVAAVLESRSLRGWYELEPGPGEDRWTVIVLNR